MRSAARDALASAATAALLVAAVTAPFLLLGGLLGLELARPTGLLLALLALPLLLLHVLRSRRPRRLVASLLLWREVVQDQRASHPFKRLRRRLTLLLQLLALACLACALAGPTVRAAVGQETRRVAIVVDVSASMLARDAHGRTRLEAAREQALRLIEGLGPEDEAMLAAAGRRPWIAVPWTDDAQALSRGLEALQARDVSGRLDQALVLVASSLPGRAEVHVFSDGGSRSLGQLELPCPLHYHRVGERGDNLGLTAVDLRPRAARDASHEEGLAYEVFASVLNTGAETRQVFVALERGGKLLAARRLSLPGGGDHAHPVVLEARLTPGPVAVRLLPADGRQPLDPFPDDDTAWLLVPREAGFPVRLTSKEPSPALRRALEAAGARLDPAGTPGLWVAEGVVPDPLPNCDLLLVAPPRDVGPIGLGAEVLHPRPGAWDRSDPLLGWVDLQDLEIERARRLQLGPGARALLQGEDPQSGEPVVLIATWSEDGSRRTVVGFDLYRSTWPLRASFPIFMRNCVEQARGDDALAGGAARTGDPVTLPVPAGADTVTVRTPDGEELQVPAHDGRAEFAATWTAGVYHVGPEGAAGPAFCVNLLAPEETRIAPRETLGLQGVEIEGHGEQADRPLDVSRAFALFAVLALVLEAWVYHRRW